MSYRLLFTQSAQNDLDETVAYFCDVLKNKSAAQKLLQQIKQTTQNILLFPESGTQCNLPTIVPLRWTPIDNFMLFYRICEETKEIHVIRFLYGMRDMQEAFKYLLP